MPLKTITEPARKVPLYGEYEVAVLGGGPAGIAAAVAPSRAGVVMHDDRRINALMVETKAGRQAVRANIFIDCSGDGDLAAWAGAPYEVGDNAGSMLYPSMMFRLNGIDPEKAGDAWRTIPALMEAAEVAGTHHFPRKAAIGRPQRSPIEWRVNLSPFARADR